MSFLIILGLFFASACGALVGHFVGIYLAARVYMKWEAKQREQLKVYHQSEKDALESFVNMQKKLLQEETIKQAKIVAQQNEDISNQLNNIFKPKSKE